MSAAAQVGLFAQLPPAALFTRRRSWGRDQLLLEDNWAVLDGGGNMLRCSTVAWPYIHGLSADGKVANPSNHLDWARISTPVITQQV